MRTMHTECLSPDQFHSAAISDVVVREPPDEDEDEEDDEDADGTTIGGSESTTAG